jgi:hypothetical protein
MGETQLANQFCIITYARVKPKAHENAGKKHTRFSVQRGGTKRAWQIAKALLPNYTQHWLKAPGYNWNYDHIDQGILAVSGRTKADPISI